MARRGRGRPKKCVSSEYAEFFKVFLPHRSSHQLLIPPDFVKDFKRTIKEKVILKDLGGKMWHVDVKETPDGVFLKKGWQNFVTYHGLQIGEFLVFRYDRCYSFVVKIFGTNGCKKEALAVHVKTEEMEETHTSNKRVRPHKEDYSLRSNKRTVHSERLGEVKSELQEQDVASELPENCVESENAESVLSEFPCFVSPPSRSR